MSPKAIHAMRPYVSSKKPRHSALGFSSRHHAPPALPVAWALVVLLSGCTTLTPPNTVLPETPVPAAWSTSAAPYPARSAAASLAQWWQRFEDPQLTALVTQALQANTDVRTAQAALQQARALRDVKSAGLGPTVNASGSAQRS
ncbi:MAG: TolC family protein, partial [Polaromonas sp.]